MTVVAIEPLRKPLDTVAHVPGSKSITNRALLLAALADGVSTLSGVLFSDDSHWFLDGLERLGVAVEVDQSQAQVRVHGVGGAPPTAAAELLFKHTATA